MNFLKQTSMKNGAGFTLLELLVVIGIIGIMSSIGIISYQAASTNAKASTVQKSINDLAPAIVLCFDEQWELTCIDEPGYYHQEESLALGYRVVEENNNCDVIGFPDFEWQTAFAQEDPGVNSPDIGICYIADSYWPDYRNYGWNYDSISYDMDNLTWEIIVSKDTQQIICTQNGCSEN